MPGPPLTLGFMGSPIDAAPSARAGALRVSRFPIPGFSQVLLDKPLLRSILYVYPWRPHDTS